MQSKSSSIPKPWRKISRKQLEIVKENFKQKILWKTGDVWDPEQLEIAAKAAALYYLKTGRIPIMNEMRYGLYMEGIGGSIHILYKAIEYKGPFTRGYRYVKVDVPTGTYKIIKIKKKRVKRNGGKGNK